MSQFHSDNDVDSDNYLLTMQLQDEFRLQECPLANLFRAWMNRCVFLRQAGFGVVPGIDQPGSCKSARFAFDYHRVMLTFDKRTLNVQVLPIDAYSVQARSTQL